MQLTSAGSAEGTTKVGLSVLGLAIAIVAIVIFANSPPGTIDPIHDLFLASAFLGVLGLLAASVVAWFRPRLANVVLLAGAALVLFWLAWTELARDYCVLSSWVVFNSPDTEYWRQANLLRIQLRVVLGPLLMFAVVWTGTRLLPDRWVLRRRAVNRRTWPAMAITLIALAAWFITGASPYRVPVFAHRVFPVIGILHVEKSGLHFYEESVRVYRDGRFDLVHRNRRLLQYRFQERVESGLLKDGLRQRALQVSASIGANQPQRAAMKPFRDWNGVGWYVVLDRGGRVEYLNIIPPVELAELFIDVQGVAARESNEYTVKDVCMGFCYDPAAGLGIDAANERCGPRR